MKYPKIEVVTGKFVAWHCRANLTGRLTNVNIGGVLLRLNQCYCNKPPSLPAIYASGNTSPGFSLSLSLRCLKQSCLTHAEAQTQTHKCYPPYIQTPPGASACESYCVSVLRCFANWLLAATASLLFRHRHLSFVAPAHLRLRFNGIVAFLPCFLDPFPLSKASHRHL